MDSIVKQLSEIETSAVNIVEHAESQKAVADKEMMEKRREFDESLNTDTVSKLAKIRTELETKMGLELEKQRQASENAIEAYRQEYNVNCEKYARDILSHITEV